MSAKASPLDHPDLDAVWRDCASALGFQVVRTQDAYASTDGRGTIFIGSPETLDDDDNLAQLVLHELCHAFVQGEDRWRLPDWGLDNTTTADDARERACLRLQAQLADEHGLRALMIPTTIWRDFYAALPADPLQAPAGEDDEACALARTALALARTPRIAAPLTKALAATASRLAANGAWRALGRHPIGWALGPPHETCGTCAWHYVGGRGPAVSRCRQSAGEVGDGRRIDPAHPACERWEPPVDCLTCGACCREAYHTVAVSMRDAVTWRQPAFVVRSGHRYSLLREGDRCAALDVVTDTASESGRRFGCKIYEDRPQTCRDFERGGRHCVTARRRVGLSR
jgi:hypothetical protein